MKLAKLFDAEVVVEAQRWLASKDITDGHLMADYLAKAIVEASEIIPIPTSTAFPVERSLPRDRRQEMITSWAEMAFGREEATGVPQRGLRLLEEAIEAFQACGCDEAMAHKLVKFVFERPPGEVGQELGGVAVTVLALAAAAKLSADEEECREIHRVLSKPLSEFTQRNANKNAAGFKITDTGIQLPRNPCCGNFGTHSEGGREYCSTCGASLGERTFP